ncbi:E3 ubiquitin-protein ligase ATL41 [Camellia lanceoleosa]|nr:E3 ubiquitin-protein ligase ATL41 [Camellia lanceoleosa]
MFFAERMSFNDFNGSDKIILSAMFTLLGIIILVTIHHFYQKYSLQRQQRRRRAITHPIISIVVAPTEANLRQERSRIGLDQSIIALLQNFVYKASHWVIALLLNFGHEESHRLGSDKATECSVCLSPIREEAKVRVLPNCKHLFHVDCIGKWLSLHTTCPMCRAMAEETRP